MSANVSFLSGRINVRRGLVFGGLIITALIAFEIFNYSTTDFALSDLLGDLRFVGIRWATILAIAFCGIDFAGIARLFTPEQGADEPTEVWYLFGAWMLAATMNAMLTWWGVSIAISNHETLGSVVVSRETLLKVVPVFVAIMVWLIRVLIIGTISVAGDRLFSQAEQQAVMQSQRTVKRPATTRSVGSISSTPRRPVRTVRTPSYSPAPKSSLAKTEEYDTAEPTYHPVAMDSMSSSRGRQSRF